MKKLFCYLVDFGTVSASDALAESLQFSPNEDFEITHIRTDLSGTCEAKVFVTKENGEGLSNAAISLRAIADERGLNIFEGTIVPAGAKWSFDGTVSAGTSQPLQLQLWGYKL